MTKSKINTVKKFLGVLWMLLAVLTVYFCIDIFGSKLTSNNQEDLVFAIIVFFILLPLVAMGLFVFGYFALTDQYKD
jgi:small-conductance mechanosensitive channel